MTARYRVEWLLSGAWVPVDSFADFAAADAWATTLLTSVDGDNGVRVIDTARERFDREAVVWSVER